MVGFDVIYASWREQVTEDAPIMKLSVGKLQRSWLRTVIRV